MKIGTRGLLLAAGVVAFAAGAIVWVLSAESPTDTWHPEAEGYLAVATPCCEEASLWSDLDSETSDGQRARPASAEDAAAWLNTWPYRAHGEPEHADASALVAAARGNEVRCVGPPSGPDVPRDGDDAATIAALRSRTECTYARWQIWVKDSAGEHPNERHTVWADENGLFHGRVDHWHAD